MHPIFAEDLIQIASGLMGMDLLGSSQLSCQDISDTNHIRAISDMHPIFAGH